MADRIFVKHVPDDSLISNKKFGDKGTCAIDQSPSKSFNIDPSTGRPVSDLTALLRASDKDAERIIKEAQQYKADFLPSDISNEDALKFYQPRLCQLPSELAELNEYQTKMQLEELKEKQKEEEFEKLRKEIEEEAAKKAESDKKAESSNNTVESK